MDFGLGLDPVNAAPSIIALVVALLICRRHRTDRRARVFLALALAELAFLIPAALFTFGLDPGSRAGLAVLNALVVLVVLLSSLLFFHFGMSFPHARPWLKEGRIKPLYLAAVIASAAAVLPVFLGMDEAVIRDRVIGGIMILSSPLAVIGAIVACIAVRRSYNEMTADERRIYRVPIMGVLAGMIAGLAADLVLGLLFASVYDTDNRYLMWTANLVATTASLLLPLFFYSAAHKFRLLERHSPDYVSGPSSAQ